MTTDLPLTAIEGIGPATAQRLSEIGVERVIDLFFVDDAAVHGAVADMASLAEVEAWRAMAALMEAPGVDAQRAEALVRGGVETIEELAGQALADLRALFADAVEDARIAEAPGEEALLAMVRGATAIDYGAVAAGTLVEEDGTPAEGATVEVGGLRAAAGERGRFRMVGLPPAARTTLRVERPGQPPHVVPEYRVHYDPRAIGGARVVLAGSPPAALDEFAGDPLPSLEGLATEWRRMAAEELREGDVLQVHDLYASAPDAKLVSIFRAVEDGRLVIRHARVPLDTFEGGPVSRGEVYRHRGGRLRPVPGGLGAVELHRAARRALRELRALGPEAVSMDADAAITWLGGALARHHVLAGSPTLSRSIHDAESADSEDPDHAGIDDTGIEHGGIDDD